MTRLVTLCLGGWHFTRPNATRLAECDHRRSNPSRTNPEHHPQGQPSTKMALLVDKLRPRSLDALTYHQDLSSRLSSLVRCPCVDSSHHANAARLHPPTSHTYCSTVPLAPARRPAFSPHSAPYTARASRRSRSTRGSSRPQPPASSSSTSSPPYTTSRSPRPTSATTTASSSKSSSKKSHRPNRSTSMPDNASRSSSSTKPTR